MVEVINAIIPPRDWLDSMQKLYIQYVSHQPASREDVIDLRNRLDRML
jgi:dynein light intermediate chain